MGNTKIDNMPFEHIENKWESDIDPKRVHERTLLYNTTGRKKVTLENRVDKALIRSTVEGRLGGIKLMLEEVYRGFNKIRKNIPQDLRDYRKQLFEHRKNIHVYVQQMFYDAKLRSSLSLEIKKELISIHSICEILFLDRVLSPRYTAFITSKIKACLKVIDIIMNNGRVSITTKYWSPSKYNVRPGIFELYVKEDKSGELYKKLEALRSTITFKPIE